MQDETNPYLAMRAAKIARNEGRLRQLGLLRPTPTAAAPASQPRKTKKVSSVKEPTPPLRRSTRHSGRPDTYEELPEPKKQRTTRTNSEQKFEPRRVVTPEAKTFPPNSARSMDIHVENLVIKDGLLGQMMESTGKAYVMQEAAQRSGLQVGQISFNKYSGVQEWKNDAMFLWVNLGNGGDVVNDFLNGGRQVCCSEKHGSSSSMASD